METKPWSITHMPFLLFPMHPVVIWQKRCGCRFDNKKDVVADLWSSILHTEIVVQHLAHQLAKLRKCRKCVVKLLTQCSVAVLIPKKEAACSQKHLCTIGFRIVRLQEMHQGISYNYVVAAWKAQGSRCVCDIFRLAQYSSTCVSVILRLPQYSGKQKMINFSHATPLRCINQNVIEDDQLCSCHQICIIWMKHDKITASEMLVVPQI